MSDLTWWKIDRLMSRSEGWREAWIATDSKGLVAQISPSAPEARVTEHLKGWTLPGFPNAHSHAFQYAMAGTTEHLAPGAEDDDFWSWREAMYGLAATLNPSQIQAIATLLYSEMARHGIASVAEFHYLHHDEKGNRYQQPEEMSVRLMEAAKAAGIGLTIIPVFYKQGGFGKPAMASQRRFVFGGVDEYLTFVDRVRKAASRYERVHVGVGVHSLRAAEPEAIEAVFDATQPDRTPRHIHLAEQSREVEECRAAYGRRPVDWLLNNAKIDEFCQVVHATHMNDAETEALARSGATTILCPTTEGNLGDGFFPLRKYLGHKGRIAIGTDSHVGLSPWEELRWLDYGQRALLGKRNIVCRTASDDSGRKLYAAAWFGGWRSLGIPRTDYFEPGQPFDAVVLDKNGPVLIGKPESRILSSMVYAGDSSAHHRIILAGKDVGSGAGHVRRREFIFAYKDLVLDAIRDL